MGKKMLFPKMLILGVFVLTANQAVMAATTASQTVTGTLGPVKQVVTNGGNITATIDPTTGALSAALAPGFTLTTNTSSPLPVAFTASANVQGGSVNAFDSTGAFIALTNSTALPLSTDVGDALSGAPSPAANPNVIAYPLTPPADIAGELVYSWDNLNVRWNGSLTHKGGTNTLLTIPATVPRASTFSIEDLDGSYQATITLSFV